MKLYTFEIGQQRKLGAEWQGQLVDLAVAYEAASSIQPPQPNRPRALPRDMLTFIRMGRAGMEAAGDALASVKKRRAAPVGEQIMYPIDAVKIRSPILRPGKIICCGLDGETKEVSDAIVSLKVASALVGHDESVIKPAGIEELIFNPQVAVVLGSTVKNVSEEAAAASVFGYTLLNDIAASETSGKKIAAPLARNFDTFCPLGPCIVTADELSFEGPVRLRSSLNGDHQAAEWTLPILRTLSTLSEMMTLDAGDIVSFAMECDGSRRVKAGDVVAIEVDAVGRLENPIAGG